MFDSRLGQTSVPNSLVPYQSEYVGIVKAENGFTLSANGATRVYSDIDAAIADLKAYFETIK